VRRLSHIISARRYDIPAGSISVDSGFTGTCDSVQKLATRLTHILLHDLKDNGDGHLDRSNQSLHGSRASWDHRGHRSTERLCQVSNTIPSRSATRRRTWFACWNLTRLSCIGWAWPASAIAGASAVILVPIRTSYHYSEPARTHRCHDLLLGGGKQCVCVDDLRRVGVGEDCTDSDRVTTLLPNRSDALYKQSLASCALICEIQEH
jgi:hypothetical protein